MKRKWRNETDQFVYILLRLVTISVSQIVALLQSQHSNGVLAISSFNREVAGTWISRDGIDTLILQYTVRESAYVNGPILKILMSSPLYLQYS